MDLNAHLRVSILAFGCFISTLSGFYLTILQKRVGHLNAAVAFVFLFTVLDEVFQLING